MLDCLVRAAAIGRNLGQVARTRRRHQRMPFDQFGRARIRDGPAPVATCLFVEPCAECGKETVDARIVEAARDGREHRHLVVGPLELDPVAAPLLAHVAQRILGAALLELVERDQVGEIEHVDLLELARRAVFARHHVHRHVDEVDDLGVALADACGFDDNEVEICIPQQVEDIGQHRAGGEVLPPRRERAHEYLLGRERVHADAVAEQGTAAAATRRVHGDDGDVAIGELPHESQQQFVGQRRLAGTAGAGDPHHLRRPLRAARNGATQGLAQRRIDRTALERGDRARDLLLVARSDRPELEARTRCLPHAREHVVDHAVEAEPAAVLGCVDTLDAVGLEFLDLVRRDRAAAAHDDADMRRAEVAQHVHHVLEVLDVAALVGTARDAVRVFLQGRAHDVGDAAVVPEVHDLGAVRLQQPADDIDRGVVTVEQRSGAHESQRSSLVRGAGSLARITFTADSRGSGHLHSSSRRAAPGQNLLLSRILPRSMIRALPSVNRSRHGRQYSSEPDRRRPGCRVARPAPAPGPRHQA